MLFNGGNFGQARMKLAVVAEDNPAFLGDCRQPFVIWRIVFESELVLGIVVVFDSKRRLRCPEYFWKASPEIPIKIERQ
jgi:hypothetical protein